MTARWSASRLLIPLLESRGQQAMQAVQFLEHLLALGPGVFKGFFLVLLQQAQKNLGLAQ